MGTLDNTLRQNTDNPKKEIKVFICYAHNDSKFFEVFTKQVIIHLNVSHHYRFTNFDDRNILVGDDWNAKIKNKIEESNLGILLLSASFLDSEYIREDELRAMLEKAKNKKDFILCPIYFMPFVINEGLKPILQYQFFKINGSDYGIKNADENTSFAQFVEFTRDGLLIENANRDIYFQKLSESIFKALAEKFTSEKKNPVEVKQQGQVTGNNIQAQLKAEIKNQKDRVNSKKKKNIIALIISVCAAVAFLIYLFINSGNIDRVPPPPPTTTDSTGIYDSIIKAIEYKIKDTGSQNFQNEALKHIPELIKAVKYTHNKTDSTNKWPELAYLASKTRSIINKIEPFINAGNEGARLERMMRFLGKTETAITDCYRFDNYSTWRINKLENKTEFVKFPERNQLKIDVKYINDNMKSLYNL